jgi:hypothetical protein
MESTLGALRAEIESLASENGSYRVVSVETGGSPVPVSGLRFETRSTGATAAMLTRVYRRSLRQWDPRTKQHDLTVTRCGPRQARRPVHSPTAHEEYSL